MNYGNTKTTQHVKHMNRALLLESRVTALYTNNQSIKPTNQLKSPLCLFSLKQNVFLRRKNNCAVLSNLASPHPPASWCPALSQSRLPQLNSQSASIRVPCTLSEPTSTVELTVCIHQGALHSLRADFHS